MTIKIAVAGKGGTGKTTLSALLCRSLLKRRVRPLLAVDADPNSCLPEALGVESGRTIGEMREELRAQPNSMPAGISKNEWIERLINEEITEASGFDLIVMGRQEGPECYCFINSVLRQCLEKLGRQYQAVVIDNEAGLEHLSRRSNGSVDVLLIVCQPTMNGARTAARIQELIRSLHLDIGALFLVLSQVDGELDPTVQAAFDQTGLEVLARIPLDPHITEFERQTRSLLELPATSPAAMAADDLLSILLKEAPAGAATGNGRIP